LEEPLDEGWDVTDDVAVVVLAKDSKYDAMQRRDTEDNVGNTDPNILEGFVVARAFNRMMKTSVAATREAQYAIIDIFAHGLAESSLVVAHIDEVAVTELCVLVHDLER
jgi:hypothetical protein